jgi:hypothetical protein
MISTLLALCSSSSTIMEEVDIKTDLDITTFGKW